MYKFVSTKLKQRQIKIVAFRQISRCLKRPFRPARLMNGVTILRKYQLRNYQLNQVIIKFVKEWRIRCSKGNRCFVKRTIIVEHKEVLKWK